MFIYHSNKTQERKVQANYWNRNDICLKVLLRDYVRHFCANIYYPLFDPIYFSSSSRKIKTKEDNVNSDVTKNCDDSQSNVRSGLCTSFNWLCVFPLPNTFTRSFPSSRFPPFNIKEYHTCSKSCFHQWKIVETDGRRQADRKLFLCRIWHRILIGCRVIAIPVSFPIPFSFTLYCKPI